MRDGRFLLVYSMVIVFLLFLFFAGGCSGGSGGNTSTTISPTFSPVPNPTPSETYNYSISGYVIDKEGEKVLNAVVFVVSDETDCFVSTDSSGNFAMSFKSKHREKAICAISPMKEVGVLNLPTNSVDINDVIISIEPVETKQSITKPKTVFNVSQVDNNGDCFFKYQGNFSGFLCTSWLLDLSLGEEKYKPDPDKWDNEDLEISNEWKNKKLYVPRRYQAFHKYYYGWEISESLYLMSMIETPSPTPFPTSSPYPTPTVSPVPEIVDDAIFLKHPWASENIAPESNEITKYPGEEFWIDFASFNQGNTTWSGNKYYLHNNFKNRGFGDYPDHYLISETVQQGKIWGPKRVYLKAPQRTGSYKLTCRMGKEPYSEFGNYINWDVVVTENKGDSAVFKQSPGNPDSPDAPEYNDRSKKPGEEFWIDFWAYNNGSTTWKAGEFYFHNNFAERGFGGFSQCIYLSSDVAPGQVWHDRYTFKAPINKNTYILTCRMGKNPNNEFGNYINWRVTVEGDSADYHCKWITQSPYVALKEGQSNKFVVIFKNTGSTVWRKGVVFLGTSHPKDRPTGFRREDDVNHNPSGWTAYNRVQLKEDVVYPGENGTFEFWMSVPPMMEHKLYREYFQPVAENTTWMEDEGVFWDINVIN